MSVAIDPLSEKRITHLPAGSLHSAWAVNATDGTAADFFISYEDDYGQGTPGFTFGATDFEVTRKVTGGLISLESLGPYTQVRLFNPNAFQIVIQLSVLPWPLEVPPVVGLRFTGQGF